MRYVLLLLLLFPEPISYQSEFIQINDEDEHIHECKIEKKKFKSYRY